MQYSPDDGGRYITAGIVVSKDPETGIPDIGHYRFEVVDKQTLTFLALPNHRFGRNLAKARRMGQTIFHAALVLGVDPVMAYTCPIQVPDGTNDFEVVGGMRGAALELVHCKTIDVDVPARAELVFELEVDFTQEVFEGRSESSPGITPQVQRNRSHGSRRSRIAIVRISRLSLQEFRRLKIISLSSCLTRHRTSPC